VTAAPTDVAPASTQPVDDFDIKPFIFGPAGNLAGPANVIMQLSWPEVGYGVVESRVESGNAMKHPIKRGRTTFTYLAVAILGTDEDRKLFRQAVNKQHVQVRNEESSKSPVEYSAMDPQLQLWVAACLYYGQVDIYTRMHGELDDATAEKLYRFGARMGTSLQVRPEMWPADREAFAAYWKDGIAKAHIDDTVRRYLDSLVNLENLPKFARKLSAKSNSFWTRGFLPPEIREMMHYTWSDEEEAKFARKLRRYGKLDHKLPNVIRLFPFNLMLWDMRRRVRKGIALV
jgi:uncharacterized protein (DUF2236 family)